MPLFHPLEFHRTRLPPPAQDTCQLSLLPRVSCIPTGIPGLAHGPSYSFNKRLPGAPLCPGLPFLFMKVRARIGNGAASAHNQGH